MRSAGRLAGALVFVLLGPASVAHAATVPFTAEFSLEVLTLTPLTVTGGGVATVNGSTGGVHVDSLQLPASVVNGAALLPITDPAVFPINGIQLSVANQAGNLTGSGGAMALSGVAKICLFGPCAAAIANLEVPLSVVGTAASAVATGPLVNVTVSGAPWTTGTASIETGGGANLTAMGFRHGPASGTSSTAAASGQIQYVTPVYISVNIGSSPIYPAFARLTLHFVPEPGTMLLIGGGLSLLAFAGRRRMRAS